MPARRLAGGRRLHNVTYIDKFLHLPCFGYVGRHSVQGVRRMVLAVVAGVRLVRGALPCGQP